MQLTHFIDKRLREATKDAEREKALKDVVEAMAKDHKKAAEVVKKKGQASEKAGALAEKRRTKLEMKLGGQSLSW